ncbi:sam domain and hd domain-containing protein, partial [Nannochloropsis gaditana]
MEHGTAIFSIEHEKEAGEGGGGSRGAAAGYVRMEESLEWEDDEWQCTQDEYPSADHVGRVPFNDHLQGLVPLPPGSGRHATGGGREGGGGAKRPYPSPFSLPPLEADGKKAKAPGPSTDPPPSLPPSLPSALPPALPPRRVTRRRFDCNLYGPIYMEGLCLAIIDTPQFQRLGSIAQLGACPLVYRGATHTRLQHSLGVAHLAGEFVKTLVRNQPDLLREGR